MAESDGYHGNGISWQNKLGKLCELNILHFPTFFSNSKGNLAHIC